MALVKLECENCKEEFEVLAKRKTAKFCSKGCATSYRQRLKDPDYMSMSDELRYYLLGLILTDGCISQQSGKQERMTLRTSDKQLAEDLHPIICPERKLYANKPYKEEHNVSYALISTNESSISALKSYGVVADKTYTIQYPDIPKEHIHHFIRGLFDGDGSLYLNKVKGKDYKHVSFTTASIDFANGLKQELESFGFAATVTKDTRKDTYYVKMYRQEEVKEFGRWIYSHSHYCLNRKKQAFSDDIV